MKQLFAVLVLFYTSMSFAYLDNGLGRFVEGDELVAINTLIEERCLDCGPNEAGYKLHSSELVSSSQDLACYTFYLEQTFDDDYGPISEFEDFEICVEKGRVLKSEEENYSLENFKK